MLTSFYSMLTAASRRAQNRAFTFVDAYFFLFLNTQNACGLKRRHTSFMLFF